MTTWNIGETKELVRKRYGRDQFELARQSLNSAVERREYARYHYAETKSLIAKGIAPLQGGDKLIVAMLGGGADEAKSTYDETLLNIGANVVACVQGLHAISDIFAHGIYFSLGLNLQEKPLLERNVKASTVLKLLKAEQSWAGIAAGLAELGSHDDSKCLDALSNLGKHRSLVRPLLQIDMTKKATEPYQFLLNSFSYGGKNYQGVQMLPFLESAFNRISNILVDTGFELNSVLRQQAP